MQSKHITILAAAAITALTAVPTLAQKSAVSIVFTEANNVSTIDTIILAGETALSDLLDHYTLSMDDIHLLRMDHILDWVPEHAQGLETKEIIMINTEEITDGNEDAHHVNVIRINGETRDMESLSEEERLLIEAQVERAHAMRKNEFEHDVEEVIVLNGNATAEIKNEEKEVRVEKRVENGKETVRAWVNGEELSEEEALAIIENGSKQKMGEKTMVFISDDEEGQVTHHMKQEISVHASASTPKAVVIVKSLPAAKKGTEVVETEGELSVYPNPANNEATVTFSGEVSGPYMVTVSNLAGQAIWRANGNAKDSIKQKIDLSGYTSGTYIVTVSHDGGVHSQKLVVE